MGAVASSAAICLAARFLLPQSIRENEHVIQIDVDQTQRLFRLLLMNQAQRSREPLGFGADKLVPAQPLSVPMSPTLESQLAPFAAHPLKLR